MFGVASVWSWGALVFAATGGTNLQVYIGPPDYCANIPGHQSSVPGGMSVDGDGNCYTPPQPTVDMCDNLPGDQTTIPAGYYKDGPACYPQPVNPSAQHDVCDNIPGRQTAVPVDYTNTTSGDCVPPQYDQCSNITGPQYIVPNELQRSSDGTCYSSTNLINPTPPAGGNTPEVSQPTAPANQDTSAKDDVIASTPAWAVFLVQPILDLLPETLVQALREMDPAAARSFAYYVFSVTAAAGIVTGAQSLGIMAAAGRLAASTRRKREVVEEKYRFLKLVCKYLDTPISAMRSASPSKTMTHRINALHDQTMKIQQNVGELKRAEEPVKKQMDHLTIRRSLLLWIPIVFTVAIVAIAHFLFGVIGGIDLGSANLVTQAVAFVLISLFLYRMLRSKYLNSHELEHRKDLEQHEYGRNDDLDHFIHDHALQLSQLLNAASSKTAPESYKRAWSKASGMLDKLQLLAKVDVAAHGAVSHFDLEDLVREVLVQRHALLSSHAITVRTEVPAVRVTQHRDLFKFIIGSLLDNAIALSEDKASITITAKPQEHRLAITVTDTDSDASPLVVSALQQAFSSDFRSLEISYDESGLSLFLDRIIMDYVEGEVIATKRRGGASLKLSVPTA